jgi:magnesium-transporting ATPase (P-type)
LRLLRASVLSNEGTLARRADAAEWAWSGDPTDVALLSAAYKAGLDPDALREEANEVAVLPFEPERLYSASFRAGSAEGRVYVKGAPERVLAMCGRVAEGEGDDGGAASIDKDAALAEARQLMVEGYRVLAIAEGPAPEPLASGRAPDEPSDLVFLGFVAMTDPPREGVEQAIARCFRAGIRVVMITGDHAVTASVIAARIGLASYGEEVLEGRTIMEMDDSALEAAVARHAVVARPGDERHPGRGAGLRARRAGGAGTAAPSPYRADLQPDHDRAHPTGRRDVRDPGPRLLDLVAGAGDERSEG